MCYQSFLSPQLELIYVCTALSISTSCQFATLTLYNMCCYFLIQRIQSINSILNQLIFDHPLSDEFLLLNSSHTILTQDFLHDTTQHQQSKRNPGMKWRTFKWLCRAEEDIVMVKPIKDRSNIDESMQRSLNRMWPVKGMGDKDASSELYHLDNLVSRFNLTDIKTLSRM